MERCSQEGSRETNLRSSNRTLMSRKRSPTTIAFGAAVRTLRVERGFAQESFAAHARMDRSYYGAIERGEFNVSLETIVKLAGALGVTAAEVLRRAGL